MRADQGYTRLHQVTLGHLRYVIPRRVYTRVRSARTHTHARPWDESFIIASTYNAPRVFIMSTKIQRCRVSSNNLKELKGRDHERT